MSTGLLALLDDVAALVKVSAASLDDIPGQVAKTSGKISGIVIDDTAVTPKYVVGLDPSRELSIIYRIARRSMINKIVILGPAALLLGFFAPWAITPLLVLGGGYLCFEGYEKVHSLCAGSSHGDDETHDDAITPQALEEMRIASAVKTDFILSSEIIAVTYASVADKNLLTQITVMSCIAIGITAAVYGFVALIVKADDIGLHMAKRSAYGFIRRFGRAIVKAMPTFLNILGMIGTAAMLWVGAEIVAHGIPFLHHALEHLQHRVDTTPALAWIMKACLCALGGLALGAVIAKALWVIQKFRARMV